MRLTYSNLSPKTIKNRLNEIKEILKTIPDVSTVSWKYFNFQAAAVAGEFDFDESQHRDELQQDLQAMFDFQIDEDDLI